MVQNGAHVLLKIADHRGICVKLVFIGNATPISKGVLASVVVTVVICQRQNQANMVISRRLHGVIDMPKSSFVKCAVRWFDAETAPRRDGCKGTYYRFTHLLGSRQGIVYLELSRITDTLRGCIQPQPIDICTGKAKCASIEHEV